MPPGELEDEPRVDRPERSTRVHPALPDQPLDLRAGEVGVDHEAGALAEQGLVSGLAQLVAARGRAPVLPDDRAVQRLAAHRLPRDDRLALIGDPDAGQRGAVGAGVLDRLVRDAPGDLPDLVRVVLDPSRAREVLLELAVGAPGGPAVVPEHDAGRARGPLVDREDHRREA